MIKNCTEVSEEAMFQVFQEGFSDYLIPLKMNQEQFISRFFGPEGNQREYSFVAFDGNRPVGIILSGLKIYGGVKTLRCGTLSVAPSYRGKGVSQALFRQHRQVAADTGCRQLFLEVIVGNDRAIRFYEKQGYEKVYRLSYFSWKKEAQGAALWMEKVFPETVEEEISPLGFEAVYGLKEQVVEIHINWQNDFEYIRAAEGMLHYGAYRQQELVGALSLHTTGKISFIWVRPQERGKGWGTRLLQRAAADLRLTGMSFSFPNNHNLTGFAKKRGFQREAIAQHEMYLYLSGI